MPQEKGKSGNLAGRPKGSPNKTTATVRETLLKIFNETADNIPDIFAQLEPAEKLNFIAKILPYLAPKMEAVSEIEKDDHVIIINRTIVEGGGLGKVFGETIQPPNITYNVVDMSDSKQQSTT